MFVDNRTDRQAVCRRAELAGPKIATIRLATIMTADVYRIAANELMFAADEPAPECVRSALSAPAWDGTSLTTSGTIRAPERGALARRILFRAGDRTIVLVARGERRWVREGDRLVPGAPAAWEPLSMQWSEAFGGSVEVPAARDERTGLPRPATVGMHPMNPSGKGFHIEERQAEGMVVPRLELLEEQLTHFGALPVPGCFAPCEPMGVGMRAPLGPNHPLSRGTHSTPFAALHLAPSYLILPWLPPATAIEVLGLEKECAFELPSPRVRVRAQRKARGARYGVRIRVVHVDSDAGFVTIVWQHAIVAGAMALPDMAIVHQEGTRP